MRTIGSPDDPAVVLFGRDPAEWDDWESELARLLAARGRYVTDTDGDPGGGSTATPRHAVARDTGVPALLDRLRTGEETGFASVTMIDPPADDKTRPIAVDPPTLVLHDSTPAGSARAYALARRFPNARCLRAAAGPGGRLAQIVPAVLSVGLDLTAQRARYRGYAEADPLGWFERLYSEAEAGEAWVPWDLDVPDPLLRGWLERRVDPLPGRRSAVVIGCGLGRDAELVAEAGFVTTALDLSETAIRSARRRFPHSAVNYAMADLLELPSSWNRAYDLVVECITVQALPASLRPAAIRGVARLVAERGTLIVVALRATAGQENPPGPPWPLAREEIDTFATDGLEPVRIEELEDGSYAGRADRWRAEFRRP